MEKKSFRWKYLESLEAPRVVHVRTTEMLSKENVYAQITVRFLTRQVNIAENLLTVTYQYLHFYALSLYRHIVSQKCIK